jgi:hypothetical protein
MRYLAVAMLVGVIAASAARSLAAESAQPAKEMKAVESTMIKEVGYDAEGQVLTLVFADTADKYVYQSVPEKVYRELMAAESKGTYFTQKIKGKYSFVKVEPPKTAPVKTDIMAK